MGLDAVEFAMEIEDHFGLQLRDDVYSHARTVGEVAALIAAGIAMTQAACLSARSFYRLRGWLEGPGGMPARSVRPSSKLADVLPSGWRRKRAWARLTSEVERHREGEPTGVGFFRVPGLIWSRRVLIARRVVTGAACVWAVITAAMYVFDPTWSALILSTYAGAIVIVVYALIDARLRFEFAEGLETVGDLARRAVAEGGPTSLHWHSHEQEVLDAVRRIASRQFDVPLEKVTAGTRLVEDLGMG
jgi:acyl carrier protein